MVYNLFDQKTDSGIKKKNISNKELAEELQNPIIKKIIKKRKVQSHAMDIVSKYNMGYPFRR